MGKDLKPEDESAKQKRNLLNDRYLFLDKVFKC
jgi:hypothetical protein